MIFDKAHFFVIPVNRRLRPFCANPEPAPVASHIRSKSGEEDQDENNRRDGLADPQGVHDRILLVYPLSLIDNRFVTISLERVWHAHCAFCYPL
jgi:hypothetical protein